MAYSNFIGFLIVNEFVKTRKHLLYSFQLRFLFAIYFLSFVSSWVNNLCMQYSKADHSKVQYTNVESRDTQTQHTNEWNDFAIISITLQSWCQMALPIVKGQNISMIRWTNFEICVWKFINRIQVGRKWDTLRHGRAH